MSEQSEKKQTVYIAESAASRCYTPILRHTLEGMGLEVLTLGESRRDRMESILACIRVADAVLISGRPDTESAVAVGAAAALERPVLHLCGSDDLSSVNVAAAVSTFVYAADDVVAKLQTVLQPGE
ncbi:hypothetical protein [Desulfovibrio sp. ZJ200]|uniref:hypothetical protein n=1 Tax=Desulfovibrio sp. ZJ200 TaxID=2709792 RepID=UPI0013ED24CC|nr:hypothetical protein [Desulfovibrio sp. ZJ200]